MGWGYAMFQSWQSHDCLHLYLHNCMLETVLILYLNQMSIFLTESFM